MQEQITSAIPSDLFQFAFIPSWFEQLYDLSRLAVPEPWRFRQPRYETQNTDTPILERYLNHVFRKLAVEYNYTQSQPEADALFHIRNEFACFHTGLYTKNFKGIFMCFDQNKRQDIVAPFSTAHSPRIYIQPLLSSSMVE